MRDEPTNPAASNRERRSGARAVEARRSDWRAIVDRFQVLALQDPRAAARLLAQIRTFLDEHGV
jgi:hypothetical protein